LNNQKYYTYYRSIFPFGLKPKAKERMFSSNKAKVSSNLTRSACTNPLFFKSNELLKKNSLESLENLKRDDLNNNNKFIALLNKKKMALVKNKKTRPLFLRLLKNKEGEILNNIKMETEGKELNTYTNKNNKKIINLTNLKKGYLPSFVFSLTKEKKILLKRITSSLLIVKEKIISLPHFFSPNIALPFPGFGPSNTSYNNKLTIAPLLLYNKKTGHMLEKFSPTPLKYKASAGALYNIGEGKKSGGKIQKDNLLLNVDRGKIDIFKNLFSNYDLTTHIGNYQVINFSFNKIHQRTNTIESLDYTGSLIFKNISVLLKYFFKSIGPALISKPVFYFNHHKIIIQLAYYLQEDIFLYNYKKSNKLLKLKLAKELKEINYLTYDPKYKSLY
jgi:hypothetical protein